MNARSMKRSMKKAQGMPVRVGPKKGATGKAKGPARSMSLVAQRAAVRAARNGAVEPVAAEAVKAA